MPEEAKKRLSPVEETESFITKDGNEIKSLEHLLETLNNISEENFKFHVNEYKNDYRDWVKYSVKDETLALELSKTQELEKTKEIVKKRIDELKKRIHMGELIKKINHFNMQKSIGEDKHKLVEDYSSSQNVELGSGLEATKNLAETKDKDTTSTDTASTAKDFSKNISGKESSTSSANKFSDDFLD